MDIYIYVLIFALFSQFFNKNIYVYSLFFVVLCLVSGYRGIDVGGDTLFYEWGFKNVKDGDFFATTIKFPEYGFVFINYIVILLNGSYRDFLIFSSFLSLLPLFYSAWKYTDKPNKIVAFYYTLYFFSFSLCFVRQLMGANILLAAYLIYSKTQNKKVFVCMALFATSFHCSCIFALITLLIEKLKFSKDVISVSIITSYFIGRGGIVPALLSAIGISRIGNWSIYISSVDVTFTINGLLLTIYLAYIIRIAVIPNTFVNVLTLGICLLNLLSFNTDFSRVSWNFTIIEIVIFATASFTTQDKLISKSMYLYQILVFLNYLLDNQGKIVPYDTQL